jgi:hypothetical protein
LFPPLPCFRWLSSSLARLNNTGNQVRIGTVAPAGIAIVREGLVDETESVPLADGTSKVAPMNIISCA